MKHCRKGASSKPNTVPLIVGAGRMARHIRRYFELKGIPHQTWNRKNHSIEELQKQLKKTSVVLLLIKDSAIEEFRNLHLKSFKGKILHFSGALHVPGIEGFHPLMTFGPKLYTLSFYEKVHFAGSSEKLFRTCFPTLSNPFFPLKTEDKAFYHALCVMSGNFPQILWQSCHALFKNMGVPDKAVALYLKKNLANFSSDPGQSLTGPLARKDLKTIEKNVAALPKQMRKLYQAFVKFHSAHSR